MSFNLAAANRTIISTGLATVLTEWGVTVLVDCTTGPHTVTLPAAAGNAGATINVIKIDGTINQLTISGTGADRINGHLTLTYVEPYAAVSMESGDGTTIVIVADSFPRFAPSLVHTSSFGVLDNSDLSCFRIDPSALPITVTINPVLDGRVGRLMIFKNIGTSTNAITLSPLAGTIEGAATYTMDQPNQCVVVCVTSLSTMAVVASFPGGADDGITTVGFGVGADFDTLADAVDSGATRIQVVADCFELRDTISTGALVLDILGNVRLDMGDFQVKMWGPGTQNRISCEGEIVWSPSTPKHLFEGELAPFTGDLTIGLPQVINTSTSTTGMRPGMVVVGADVPGGTTILTIDGPNAFTMTQNANATVVGEAFNTAGTVSSFNLSAVGRFEINGASATADDCHVVHGATSFACIGALILQLPNQHGWGLHAGDALIYIQGGPVALVSNSAGNNCYDHLSISGGGVTQLLVIGNYHATNPLISPASISLLSIVAPFSSVLNISVGGFLGEYNGAALMNITVLAAGTVIENCFLQGGAVDVASFANVTLSNSTVGDVNNQVFTAPGATVLSNLRRDGSPPFALDFGLTRSPHSLGEVATTGPYTPQYIETIYADASLGAFAVTLPTTTGLDGRTLSVKKIDASANAVTVTAFGGELIDGAATLVLAAQYEAVTIYCDSGNWHVLARVSTAGGGGGGWTDTGTDVILTTLTDQVGIGTATPITGLHVKNSFMLEPLPLADFPAGGSIGAAAATVDIYPGARITQTTAGQVLTLPFPTTSAAVPGRIFYIENDGTAAFTVAGAVVSPNRYVLLLWEFPAWRPSGNVLTATASTNNALVRFDGINGDLIQNSSAILNDVGGLSLAPSIGAALDINGDGSGGVAIIGVLVTNDVGGRTLLYLQSISATDPSRLLAVDSNNASVASTILIGPGAAMLMSGQVAMPGGTPPAAYGGLFTTNASPTRLAFTDDAGTTILLGGDSGWNDTGTDIILQTLTDQVGIGTATPIAGLHVKNSFMLEPIQLANFAAGGAIGTAAATVDIYPGARIPQTTAGQTLSLPGPTVAGTFPGRVFYVINNGSAAFTMHGATVNPGRYCLFIWAGPVWRHSSSVTGPISAVDNALARFDGTTGDLVQDGTATLSDGGGLRLVPSGLITGLSIDVDASTIGGITVTATNSVANRVLLALSNFDPASGTTPLRINNSDATKPGIEMNGLGSTSVMTALPSCAAPIFLGNGAFFVRDTTPSRGAFKDDSGDEKFLGSVYCLGPNNASPTINPPGTPYAAALDEIILADFSGGPGTVQIQLPATAASATQDIGRQIIVKVSVADAGGIVQLITTGGGTVDFGASYSFSGATRASVTLVVSGVNSFIVT